MNDEQRLREVRDAAERYAHLQFQSDRARLDPSRMRETSARELRNGGFLPTADNIDDFVGSYAKAWEAIDTRGAVFFRLPDLQLGRDPVSGLAILRPQELGLTLSPESRQRIAEWMAREDTPAQADETPQAYSERFLRRQEYLQVSQGLDLGGVDDVVALTADERYELETGRVIGFAPKGRVLERERDEAARGQMLTMEF